VLNLAGIAVDALSIGGLETCIQLPGLDLAFDMGSCPPSAVHRSTVCFTHAHIDHMGGVAHHCATRALTHLGPPTYLVPAENVEAFHDLLAVWRRLDRSELACHVVRVAPGDEHAVRPGLVAIPFRSPHRVPCIGYALWEERKKLKAELQGLDGDRIRELKQSGQEVTERVRAPIVAFTGDSLIEVVEREAVVREAKLLIMEVTFVDDRVSVAQCRDKGHIHLDEVIERADLFQNQAILFTHLSARYRAEEARAIVEQRLPPSLKERVTLLLAGRS
jgi:ribonuclease Z